MSLNYLGLPKDCQRLIYKKCEIQERINLRIAMGKRRPIKTAHEETIAVIRIAMKKRKRKDMTTSMLDFFQSNLDDPTIKTIMNDNKRIDLIKNICDCIESNTLTKEMIVNTVFENEELNLVHNKLTQHANPTTFALVYTSNESFKTYFKERHTIPIMRATCIFDSVNQANFALAKHLLKDYKSYGISNGVYTQEVRVVKDVLSRVVHCRQFVWENVEMTKDEKHTCFDRLTDALDIEGIKEFLHTFPDF